MNWYLQVLKKYAIFSGRARRKEYWMFFLFNVIISIVLIIIDKAIGTYSEESGRGLISTLYSLAVLLPSLAVAVRRMHDLEKSGWFILIPVYNIILACTEGTKGDNEYGSDPKEIENKAKEHLQKEITIRNKNSNKIERVTVEYWEKIKKTYGEDAYEIIENQG